MESRLLLEDGTIQTIGAAMPTCAVITQDLRMTPSEKAAYNKLELQAGKALVQDLASRSAWKSQPRKPSLVLKHKQHDKNEDKAKDDFHGGL